MAKPGLKVARKDMGSSVRPRTCTTCNTFKDVDAFYVSKRRSKITGETYDTLQSQCKACVGIDRRAHAYGISRDLVVEMVTLPCEVCGSMENQSIDHCHTSGSVRGVLCRSCNTALGMTKEDPEILMALAEYARKHRG